MCDQQRRPAASCQPYEIPSFTHYRSAWGLLCLFTASPCASSVSVHQSIFCRLPCHCNLTPCNSSIVIVHENIPTIPILQGEEFVLANIVHRAHVGQKQPPQDGLLVVLVQMPLSSLPVPELGLPLVTHQPGHGVKKKSFDFHLVLDTRGHRYGAW